MTRSAVPILADHFPQALLRFSLPGCRHRLARANHPRAANRASAGRQRGARIGGRPADRSRNQRWAGARYQLILAAGQFVRVVVEQEGVDFALSLWSVNSKLSEVDSPNGNTGLEEFAFVATTSGTYRLQISAADAKAAPGRYKAELVELHVATEMDQQRAAADQTLREGLALYAQASRRQDP